MGELADVDAGFDAALNLEETHIDEGWEEGLREGERLGRVDGRELGFAKGFEIGQEIGFYGGCHAVWSRCVREDPECFSDRAKKGVETFGASLAAFPLRDPQDVAILETLNAIRGKFKAIVAALGMHREYNALEPAAPEMSF